MEQHYIKSGLLYTTHTPFYWLGLVSSPDTYPKFVWANAMQPPPNRFLNSYEHWGAYPYGQEPDNRTGADFCAGGNLTEAYSLAWGWADSNCSVLAPSICKVDGAWQCCLPSNCFCCKSHRRVHLYERGTFGPAASGATVHADSVLARYGMANLHHVDCVPDSQLPSYTIRP